jgi:endonuclease/exonuclease/phosphatase family metal-dependent hydrolase
VRTLRIMTWNVLEGFNRPGTADVDLSRLERARTVVARLGPDVLVLNEALWCEPHGDRHVDYASLLRFPHCRTGLYDCQWGNAVLSMEPIRSARKFSIYNRGGLGVTLESGLSVATYHPHPSRRPHMRARDVRTMLLREPRPLVFCGDLNAISPEDAVNVPALETGFARFASDPAVSVARFVEGGREMFRELEAAGMRDAIPEAGRRHTIPTDLLSKDKGSAMRLDHVMVSADVDVMGGMVVEDADAEAASDHRPVYADLSFRPTT